MGPGLAGYWPAHTGPSSRQWPGLAGIASTYGDQLTPVVKATREGDRPFGKEAGHLERRQAIGKGGQGHLGKEADHWGRPSGKEADHSERKPGHTYRKKRTQRKEGKEGREE